VEDRKYLELQKVLQKQSQPEKELDELA